MKTVLPFVGFYPAWCLKEPRQVFHHADLCKGIFWDVGDTRASCTAGQSGSDFPVVEADHLVPLPQLALHLDNAWLLQRVPRVSLDWDVSEW